MFDVRCSTLKNKKNNGTLSRHSHSLFRGALKHPRTIPFRGTRNFAREASPQGRKATAPAYCTSFVFAFFPVSFSCRLPCAELFNFEPILNFSRHSSLVAMARFFLNIELRTSNIELLLILLHAWHTPFPACAGPAAKGPLAGRGPRAAGGVWAGRMRRGVGCR